MLPEFVDGHSQLTAALGCLVRPTVPAGFRADLC